ncbi:hypothetical protein AB5N19_09160 [Seiridium cardinale]
MAHIYTSYCEPSMQLLDFLITPIVKPQWTAPNSGERFEAPAKRDESWLSIHPDYRNNVRRWKDFNYPLLRIVLKRFLDHQICLYHVPLDSAWLRSDDYDSPSLTPIVNPELVLIDHVNIALRGSATQAGGNQCWFICRRSGRTSGSGQAHDKSNRELLYTQETGNPEHDWEFSAQGHLLVAGLNRSAADFPLEAFNHFNEDGRFSRKIEWALRQIGTVCCFHATPYGFILTPQGAVILQFSGDCSWNPTGPRNQLPSHLTVQYAVIPWDHNKKDILQIPLAMALWALCIIALFNATCIMPDGSRPPLNIWRELDENGIKIHEHIWLKQRNRGHPPGAQLVNTQETRVWPSVRLGLPSTSSYLRRPSMQHSSHRFPNLGSLESSAPIPTSSRLTRTSKWYLHTSNSDQTQLAPEHSRYKLTSSQAAPAASNPPEIRGQMLPQRDVFKVSSASKAPTNVLYGEKMEGVENKLPDPWYSPPGQVAQEKQLSKAAKRKQVTEDADEHVEDAAVPVVSHQPWSTRLRPRKKRPNYRA